MTFSEDSTNVNTPAEPADAEALALQRCLALALEVQDISHAEDVIRAAVSEIRRKGYLRMVASALAESTQTSLSDVVELFRDHQNMIEEHGYIGSEADAAQAVLEDLAARAEDAVHCGSTFYLYFGRKAEDGDAPDYYVTVSLDVMESHIRTLLDGTDMGRGKARRAEILSRVVATLNDPGFFDDAEPGLNVANGFLSLDPDTGQLRLEPHDARFKARSRLDVTFDVDAVPEAFLAALEQSLDDPGKVAALQEAFGAILFNVRPNRDAARRLFLLKGPRNTGKSTIINIVTLLVPGESVCSLPPENWGREYDRAQLEGKQLNIVTELGGGRMVAGDHLKRIVTGEPVTARHPYGRPFTFTPDAAHLFATNELPRVTDQTSAFERRVLVIDFNRSLQRDEIDGDFLTRVRAELPGIVNWAAEGAQRLLQRGEFTIPPGHEEAVLTMQFGRDPVELFVRTRVEAAEGESLSTVELREALLAFGEGMGCDTANWSDVSHARKLADRLKELYGAERYKVQGLPRYRGVRLKPQA